MENYLDILYFNYKLIFTNKIIEKIFLKDIYYKLILIKLILMIVKNGKEIFLNLMKENKWIFSPCFQFIKNSFLLNNKINFF